MELNHFTETFTVLNADGDFRRMLKPSALFRYVEQAAADHARAYDMDDAFFAALPHSLSGGKTGGGDLPDAHPWRKGHAGYGL